MKEVTVFKTIHEGAAAIDIGSEKIFVSPDGEEVVSFDTFTSDYYQCVGYLQLKDIKEVAMEATGVYWIALYFMLESCGFKVCLVNPKETKQVKGRKTDVKDCQWIQKLFSAGILRQSFIPEQKYMELRQLVRERLDIIEMGSTYVNKMQKYLELMNIKLTEVISEIHGASGIKMIKAIISGNRDKEYILSLCDKRIVEKKGDRVLKALEGNYSENYIFLLAQNLIMWERHQEQVSIIDKRIELQLEKLSVDKKLPINSSKTKAKSIRHHAPEVKGLHDMLMSLYGVDMNTVSGINDYTLLRLIGETGVDMSKYPMGKNFVGWCGLAPKHHQSGRTNKRVKGTKCNNAGQIFKEIAHALINSKYIAIGVFMRRIRARKSSSIAIKAGARKLALAYYNTLTKGVEYVEAGVKNYQEQLEKREKSILKKLAKKYNMNITDNKQFA